jgi:hypothetical protein
MQNGQSRKTGHFDLAGVLVSVAFRQLGVVDDVRTLPGNFTNLAKEILSALQDEDGQRIIQNIRVLRERFEPEVVAKEQALKKPHRVPDFPFCRLGSSSRLCWRRLAGKNCSTMRRTTATFSVSLPPEMMEELEQVRKAERRTRSELIREALRRYRTQLKSN